MYTTLHKSMQENTTIRISAKTKEKLNNSKVVDCETYDSVISRLIELTQKQKKLCIE
jgi:hypothetical protein